MELVSDWKTLQLMGNREFEQQRWVSASQCYLQSISLIRRHLPEVIHQQPMDGLQLIICLSIGVQNLSDTFCRQDRTRRGITLLSQTLEDFQQWQKSLSPEHPANVALLRESCQLRQRLMMHKTTTRSTTTDNTATADPEKPTRLLLH